MKPQKKFEDQFNFFWAFIETKKETKLVSLKQTIDAQAKIKSQSITAIKDSFYPSWLVRLTSTGVYPLTVND